MPDKVTRRSKYGPVKSAFRHSSDPSGDNISTSQPQRRSPLHTTKGKKCDNNRRPVWQTALVYLLAILAGYLHWDHVSRIHENHLHFSYLSDVERELSFRTEMGFYYSYFKQLAVAPSYPRGLLSLVQDNTTEYPDTINALRRFNLYPEVVIGGVYRLFVSLVNSLGLKLVECFQMKRGDDLPVVLSCEGLTEMPIFYVNCVFLVAGFFSMFCFFLLGCEIAGGSIWGGVLAVASFFCNHDDCTRVQWTPPLRESFSYPLFVLQQLVLVRVLRSCRQSGYLTARRTDDPASDDSSTTNEDSIDTAAVSDSDSSHPQLSLQQLLSLSLVTVLFMLPWQFAQFALLTQSLAVMSAYLLDHLSVRQFRLIVRAYLLALAVSFALQFGNRMLLSSAYSACLLAMLVVCALHYRIRAVEPLRNSLVLRCLTQLLILGVSAFLIKLVLGMALQVEDDKHIWEILISKFTSYSSFHTKIYTCAKEFDFIELKSFTKLTNTLLLPSTIVACLAASYRLVVSTRARFYSPASPPTSPAKSSSAESESESEKHYCGPEVPYLLAQLAAFTAMATMIMRLKLFWTPQMCLTVALLARPHWPPVSFASRSRYFRAACVVGLLAGMAVYGSNTIQGMRSMTGEFSNWSMEQLVTWLRHTKPTAPGPDRAAFAGPMAIMAAIRLGSGRPIVNHPHYENAKIRHRTELAYSFYSRLPVEEIWRRFRHQLKATYIIFEPHRCPPNDEPPGCSHTDLFDLLDPANRHQRPMCGLLLDSPSHSLLPFFRRVFSTKSGDIEVLKVWDGKSS